MGRVFLKFGNVTLSGDAPNGQFSILMPRKIFRIKSAKAKLEGEDLGEPTMSNENPAIGDVKFPKRPILAIGVGYFEILDQEEYLRTIDELKLKTDIKSFKNTGN